MSNKSSDNKKKSGKKVAIITIAVIVVLILAVCVAALITVDRYLRKINRVKPGDVTVVDPSSEDFETDVIPPDDTAEIIEPDDVEWGTSIPAGDDHLINILLVGQDRREGQGRQRSDSMILCSINVETKEIALISFLRDLYVQIPGGYSNNRLNATYAFGGFPLLDATLNHNFGVTIDGNVEVDFTQFCKDN